MCTLKSLNSIEIQCRKRFHLKSKAAINYTEISSLICETILIFNEHSFQCNLLYAKFTEIISPYIMCVQYIGGCSVHWGDIMSTSGGYHEYIGGIS